MLAAAPDPAQSVRESLPGPDRGHRRPGQERAGGDDQAHHQDRAERFLDEPDERVEQGGSGISGQLATRHAAQVDAAEDQQPTAGTSIDANLVLYPINPKMSAKI